MPYGFFGSIGTRSNTQRSFLPYSGQTSLPNRSVSSSFSS